MEFLFNSKNKIIISKQYYLNKPKKLKNLVLQADIK